MNAAAPDKPSSTQAEIAIIDAVHSFASARRPSDADKKAIEALTIEYLPRMDRHALVQVANALAPSPNTPPGLAAALASLDIHICSTFLASSPALGERTLLDIVQKCSIEHSRSIARRPYLPRNVASALRALFDDRIDRALDLRQKPSKFTKHERATDPIGQTGAISENEYACTATELLDIIELAHAGHERAVITLISDKLMISLESTQMLVENVRSGNLLHALRAMNFAEDEAWSFYEAIAGSVVQEEGLQDRFRKAFAGLALATSLQIVRSWRLDDIMQQCLAQPDSNDHIETAA